MKKRMPSPFFRPNLGGGEGVSLHKLPASQSAPEVQRTLLDPACSPFSTLAYSTPVLLSPCSGALGAPPPPLPQAGPQDCARLSDQTLSKSDSSSTEPASKLLAPGPMSVCVQAPGADWVQVIFPKVLQLPWESGAQLHTWARGELWSTSPMTLYPSSHLVKMPSLVWHLRPSVNWPCLRFSLSLLKGDCGKNVLAHRR